MLYVIQLEWLLLVCFSKLLTGQQEGVLPPEIEAVGWGCQATSDSPGLGTKMPPHWAHLALQWAYGQTPHVSGQEVSGTAVPESWGGGQ